MTPTGKGKGGQEATSGVGEGTGGKKEPSAAVGKSPPDNELMMAKAHLQMLTTSRPEAWIGQYLKVKKEAPDHILSSWDDCYVQQFVKLGFEKGDVGYIISR